MQGWTLDDVQALPQDVYDELVEMLNEEAQEQQT